MIHSKNKYVTLDYIAYATGLTFASVRTAIRTLRQYKYVLNTAVSDILRHNASIMNLTRFAVNNFGKKKAFSMILANL